MCCGVPRDSWRVPGAVVATPVAAAAAQCRLLRSPQRRAIRGLNRVSQFVEKLRAVAGLPTPHALQATVQKQAGQGDLSVSGFGGVGKPAPDPVLPRIVKTHLGLGSRLGTDGNGRLAFGGGPVSQIRFDLNVLRNLSGIFAGRECDGDEVQVFRLVRRRFELKAGAFTLDVQNLEWLVSLHNELLGHGLSGIEHAEKQRGGADRERRNHAPADFQGYELHAAFVCHDDQFAVKIPGRRVGS